MKMGYKKFFLLMILTGAVMILGLPHRLAFASPKRMNQRAATKAAIAQQAIVQARVVSCNERNHGIVVTLEPVETRLRVVMDQELQKMVRERQKTLAELRGMPLPQIQKRSKERWQVTRNNRCTSDGQLVDYECDLSRPAGYRTVTRACSSGQACVRLWGGGAECQSTCGNGVVGSDEQCDGSNRNGATCYTFGYAVGYIGCDDCRFDFSDCGAIGGPYDTPPDPDFYSDSGCGNWMIDPGEVCDGNNRGTTGSRCTDLGYAGGSGGAPGSSSYDSLSCRDDCQGYSTRNCYGNTGNPTATTPPAGDTGYEAVCGNFFLDSGEHCERAYTGIFVEGDDGPVVETCAGRGYTGGAIRCSSDCESVDTTGCYGSPGLYGTVNNPPDDPDYVARCGNQFWDEGEECERIGSLIATPDDSEVRCSYQGFLGGELRCIGCQIDTDRCYGGTEGDRLGQHCGDGVIQSTDGEECDGSNLAGATCPSHGFDTGTLRCRPYECRFDESGCYDAPWIYGTP